ncbi:MAG: transposase [Planctomycetota bacterium]
MQTDDTTPPMSDPIAYFLTWVTYGTWLPGDARGWVELKHGWQLPNANLESDCESRMGEEQCLLSAVARQHTAAQIEETCQHRGWTLHTLSVRSNHLHAVVAAANVVPKKIRADLKAWATRRLKHEVDESRNNWWADRGSVRYIWNEESLERVIVYVTEAQDRKDRDHT